MFTCRFAKEQNRFVKVTAPLSTLNGVSKDTVNMFSTALIIGNMMVVAFFASKNSDKGETTIHWTLRGSTLLQFADAVFRIVGLMKQPALTSRRRKVTFACLHLDNSHHVCGRASKMPVYLREFGWRLSINIGTLAKPSTRGLPLQYVRSGSWLQ